MIIQRDIPNHFEKALQYDDREARRYTYQAFVQQQELKKHNEKQSAGASMTAPTPLIEPVDLLLTGTMMLVSIVLLLFVC
ncbi:TPA: hypothetical protein U2L65_004879 [Citrobacter farmeri]|uniref:hypothetical protein n=1 Tax=Citrobacter farmeri TaxID=67824 RepID=UPI001E49679C|nr:hypothetical protein [Citrobacter farmeri]GJL46446.1 hypothetical protein TUM17580_25050 [Citrobacter farmeri]HEM7972821.1 hypothetical protein [Citrobacter farmeri]HEM7973805.1 hypothetical protein [Citrobacter farmeri]HEM7986583.1 hypothetical protein [Citrobacter farmeri]HEM7988024.1 hypothetical protein [Citrobacter farmeri]